jgi:hypothetical protein
MDTCFGAHAEDFRAALPTGVVIQTTAENDSIDRLAILQFLLLVIATMMRDSIHDADQELERSVSAGLRIVVMRQTQLDVVALHTSSKDYIMNAVKVCLPELMTSPLRCRSGLAPDLKRSVALNFVIWVFTRIETN